MRALIDNVFRRQLKRLADITGAPARVFIEFGYSDESFTFDVSINTPLYTCRRILQELREENIKTIVDCLINKYNSRTIETNEIRMSDFEPRVMSSNTINVEPYVSHLGGEIRDSGTTLMEQLQEVCNG